MKSSSIRRSRLVSLSIFCTAILHLNLSSVDAFSLVQNSAAASPSDGGGGSVASSRSGGSGSPAASPASPSANAAVANPFRGSLNSRRQRQRARQHREGSDDFAVRMVSHQHQSEGGDTESRDDDVGGVSSSSSQGANDATITVDNSDSTSSSAIDDEKQLTERRQFLHGMIASTVATAAVAGFSTIAPDAANAYEQSYPIELQAIPYGDTENSSNSLSKLKEERLSNKKAKVAATKSELLNDPLGLNQSPLSANFGLTIAGASTWALALWLAAGSRSNPLATPLANVLYDEQEEPWLADRNAGYFAALPPAFTALLSLVFVFLGVLLDRAAYFLSEGDAEASLGLAGVTAIGGAVWEVGRVAAEEKAPTRAEGERDARLAGEFAEFAARRLVVGAGSCHRSDVIGAFRRFNPKYRRAESEQYPLGDLEIERLLRTWNRESGSGNEMSSAGFFAGITVDGAADAFAPR